jgi:hypothetical protein
VVEHGGRGGDNPWDLPRPTNLTVPGFVAIALADGTWSTDHPAAISWVEAWCPQAPDLYARSVFTAAEASVLACAMWRGASPRQVATLLYGHLLSVGQDSPWTRAPFARGFADRERHIPNDALPPLPQHPAYQTLPLPLPRAASSSGCIFSPAAAFWQWFAVDNDYGRRDGPDNGEVLGPPMIEFLPVATNGRRDASFPADLDGDGLPELGVSDIVLSPRGRTWLVLLTNHGCLRTAGIVDSAYTLQAVNVPGRDLPDLVSLPDEDGACATWWFDGQAYRRQPGGGCP